MAAMKGTGSLGALAVAAVGLVLSAPMNASAAFAPLDRPGPKLTIPKRALKMSLECSEGVRGANRSPVLLTPATTVTSEQNYSWNWEHLLDAEGIPWCTTDQQGEAATNMTDIQVRGRYVTWAIRKVHRLAGHRITVMGHSQGGMIMRFSLRFWPDTRRKVGEVIAFAGTNHGSTAIQNLCLTGCAPALWQQRDDSNFVKALNSRQETFARIDYTEIYSETDEFVQPPAVASSVHGPGRITNVSLQSICPTALSEHLLIGTTDPVAAALALDALGHPGPADPERIAPGVCAAPHMPGFDPLGDGPVGLAGAVAQVAEQLALFPKAGAEPPLYCWTQRNPARCRADRRG